MSEGSVGDEISRFEQWLYATLEPDTALRAALGGAGRVHSDEVPPGALFPACVYQFNGGDDVRGAGPHRIMLNGVWIVKCIVPGRDILAAKPAADRIDVLLQGSSGSADGASIFSCVRDAPVRYPERTADGKDFRHLGGRYRAFVQHLV